MFMVPGAATQENAPAGRFVLSIRLRRSLDILGLSVCCGWLAGLGEVGAILLRKHLVDIDGFYRMSQHFVWLIPVTDLLILLAIGAPLALLGFVWPARGGPLAGRILATLALLAVIWRAFPGIYAPAGLVLAIGAAIRLASLLERDSAASRRWAWRGWMLVSIVSVATGTTFLHADRLRIRRAEERPLPPPGSPNVLLVVLDTVAADHLSLYGYHRPTSPALDQAARQGVRFDRARATSSWTLPSHGSLFTGRWPHELSAGWMTPLDTTHRTLAEYLGSRGYATAGFVGNLFYCSADGGLARGFDVYRDFPRNTRSALLMSSLISRPIAGMRSIEDFFSLPMNIELFRPLIAAMDAGRRKSASEVNREFLDWVTRRPTDRPFFAFLNLFDAHYPYRLPDRAVHRFGTRPVTARQADLIDRWRSIEKPSLTVEETDFARDAYDDCLAALDEQLGTLLDEIPRLGPTWVIITADHGESFGEHPGVFGHGSSLYRSQVHVPLVIIPPGRNLSGQVVTETVSLRDLPATIVDITHLESGAPFPGESLAPFWQSSKGSRPRQPSPALSEVVLTDTLQPDQARMLRDRQVWAALANENWTYMSRQDNRQERLFDRKNDINESRDLASDPSHRPLLDRLRSTMDRLTDGPLTLDRFKP